MSKSRKITEHYQKAFNRMDRQLEPFTRMQQTIDQIYQQKPELQQLIEKIQTPNEALLATFAAQEKQEKMALTSALSSLREESKLASAFKSLEKNTIFDIDGAFQAPDYIRQIQQQLEPFRGAQRFAEQISRPIIELQQLLTLKMDALKKFAKSYIELPSKIQDAASSLANYGWYFDFNIPLSNLWDIEEAIASGEIDQAEAALAEYFENHLQEIEQFINKQFPHRAHIITQAIKAYRNGDHYLAIPALFTQADGICLDLFSQHLFIRKNKKPQVAIFIEEIESSGYESAILSPLVIVTPITASKHEREKGFNRLNWHMVLHGESLDYGTKVNTLKVISLINYLAYVSHMLKN